MERIQRFLDEFLAHSRQSCADIDTAFSDTIVERLSGFVLGGGKRLRPCFAWWGWRAAGGADHGHTAETVLRAVSALELLQACALIHDDVMDGSPVRRNAPSAHVGFARSHAADGWAGDSERYGAALATLTGDLALAWADDMLNTAGLPPWRLRRARGPWQAMRTEMMAGQFLDLHGQARRDGDEDAALKTNRLKAAAYSVERPLQMGAAIADAGDELVRALRGFGTEIGMAFQLRDDVLGVFGDPESTGKPIGDDVREGKRTLLMVVGLRRAERAGDGAALAVLEHAMGNRELTARDIDTVRVVLDEVGARRIVEDRIRRRTREGLWWLTRARLDPAVESALFELALRATDREH